MISELIYKYFILKISPRTDGIFLVMSAGIFWSTSGLIYRLIEKATAWQVLFYRSLALFVLLILLLSFRYQRKLFKKLSLSLKKSFIGGFCLGIAFSCYILALEYTSVPNAMFILALAPFTTALLGKTILGESILGYMWICMALTGIGLGIMAGEEISLGRGLGELFAMMAALGFSGMTVSLRYNHKIDLLITILVASFLTSLFAGVMIMIKGEGLVLNSKDWIYSCGMGIFQIGLGFLLYTKGAQHLQAVELTLLSLTEIIVGPLLVWVIIDESPSVNALIGGAIIFSSILMMGIWGSKENMRVTNT